MSEREREFTPERRNLRRMYRAGRDAGQRLAFDRFMAATPLQDVALELTLLRATVAALETELAKRDRSIEWYKGKLLEFVRHVTKGVEPA
jgi:hypothetical protein